MAVSALQPLKRLNASNTGDLTGEELSFELSRVTLHTGSLYFHADFSYSHMNKTALKDEWQCLLYCLKKEFGKKIR